MKGTLTEEELASGRRSLHTALEAGASKVRITLNKSQMDLVATLDGEIDRVSHCLDRSLTLALFVDGRYGIFSTNRLDDDALKEFTLRAVETVRMLAPDVCRNLPELDRVEKGAASGLELVLYDAEYEQVSPDLRRRIALEASFLRQNASECQTKPAATLSENTSNAAGERIEPELANAAAAAPNEPEMDATALLQSASAQLLSEEGEYSDSVYDTVVIDSEGTFCRHIETSFEYGVEVTIADKDSNRISAYWWDAAPFLKDLDYRGCTWEAIRRATAQIGPKRQKSRKTKLVIDREVSSKVVTPLLNALAGSAIQQHNSFLDGTLGQQVLSEKLTIIDDCRTPGRTGCRLFDSEGVATTVHPIIENGVVKEYFLNTYMAAKTGMAPTTEDATCPHLLGTPEAGLTQGDLLALCGDGILVTAFNGGNFNAVTGDFSYGIEGFAFKKGRITHPIREMLMTGNLKTLWNNLIAAAEDARPCASRIIPSLAFDGVDFSA